MFKVTIPDDPDLPLKEEDKHQTEKILEAPLTVPDIDQLADMAGVALESLDTIFNDAIPQLISIVEEVNPPEKTKIIGKLRGALELFNTK